MKKLQLKKGVIARLNKDNMNLVAGGDDHTLTCPTMIRAVCVLLDIQTQKCHSNVMGICVAVGQLPTFHYECSNTCP